MFQCCCRTRIGSASPKATEPQAFRSIQARSKHGGEHKRVSQFTIILEKRYVQSTPMRLTDYRPSSFVGHHPTLLSAAQRSAPSLPIYHDVPYTPPPVRRVQTTMSFGSRSATGVIMGIRRTLSIQMQPERPLNPPPGLLRGLRNILTASCVFDKSRWYLAY